MTARAHFEKLKVLTCGLVLCNFARLMENPCLHTHTRSHFTYFTADHVLDLLVEVYEQYNPSLFKHNLSVELFSLNIVVSNKDSYDLKNGLKMLPCRCCLALCIFLSGEEQWNSYQSPHFPDYVLSHLPDA